MSWRGVIAGLVGRALLFACFVWPTPWEYGVEYWEPLDRPLNDAGPVERVPVLVRVYLPSLLSGLTAIPGVCQGGVDIEQAGKNLRDDYSGRLASTVGAMSKPGKSKEKKKTNTGKPYEEAAELYFRKQFPEARIERGVHVEGLRDTEQIDVLITAVVGPYEFRLGVEAKDYTRRLDKDRFGSIETKFKSARLNKGIILCSNGVQSGVQKRIESSNFDFELEVLTYEELIEGAWSFDFLEAVPQLRAAKSTRNIDEKLAVKVCLAIQAHAHYAKYFFHELENPAWVPVVMKHGVFEQAVRSGNQLLANLISTFVCKFASEHPNSLVTLAEQFQPPQGWIECDLLAAGPKVPKEVRAKLLDIVAHWETFVLHCADTAAELIELGFVDAQYDQALQCLTALTRLNVVTDEGFLGHDVHHLTSPLDEFVFKELTLDLFPRLTRCKPAVILPYARKRLHDANLAEHPWANGDFCTLSHHHVADMGQFGPHGYLDALLFGYRDALLAAADVNPEELIFECEQAFSEPSAVAPLRCVLFVIAKRSDILGSLFDTVIGQRDWWADTSLEPELETFVELSWPRLSDSQRTQICELILNRPGRKYHRDVSPAKAEHYRQVHIVQWLALVKELGVPAGIQDRALQTYETLSITTGVTGRSVRQGVVSGVVDSTPEVAGQFKSMSADEILAVCCTFESQGSRFDEKTPHGLCGPLKEEIIARIHEFITHRDTFSALPHHCYIAAIIDALAVVGARGELDTSILVKTTDELISVSEALPDPTGDPFDFGCSSWTRSSAVYFIREVCHLSNSVSSAILCDLQLLWNRLRLLCSRDVESVTQEGQGDYVFASLNTIDGQLSGALCALAVRSLNLKKSDIARQEDHEASQVVYEKIKSDLVEFVLSSDKPRVLCPFGFCLISFWLSERALVERFLSDHFPSSRRDLIEGLLSGYFLNPQRDASLFDALRPFYEFHLSQTSTGHESRDVDEGIGTDIGLFWWTSHVADDDPLLEKFLGHSSPTAVWAALQWVNHQTTKDSGLENWRKVIRFWHLVLEFRLDSAGDTLSQCFRLLKDAPLTLTASEVSQILIAGTSGGRLFVNDDVMSFLRLREVEEPIQVATVLVAIAKSKSAHITSTALDEMKECAAACYLSGDSSAVELAIEVERQMLLKGAMAFEGAVTGFRKPSSEVPGR